MSYEDRVFICRDCGNKFVFTAGEQEFYSQKGFLNDPVRCPDCRRARKQAREKTSGRRPPQDAKEQQEATAEKRLR